MSLRVVALSSSDLCNQGHGEHQDTEYHSCLTPLLVKLAFSNSRSLRTLERIWRKKTFPFVKDQLKSALNKLGINKPVGPNRILPQMLRELSDGIMRLLLITFERL